MNIPIATGAGTVVRWEVRRRVGTACFVDSYVEEEEGEDIWVKGNGVQERRVERREVGSVP